MFTFFPANFSPKNLDGPWLPSSALRLQLGPVDSRDAFWCVVFDWMEGGFDASGDECASGLRVVAAWREGAGVRGADCPGVARDSGDGTVSWDEIHLKRLPVIDQIARVRAEG